MKKKVLAGLLTVVGVSTGVMGIMQYVESRNRNLTNKFSQRLTESELSERYPNSGCLAEKLREHLAYLLCKHSDDLDITQISCQGDSTVSVSLRDANYDYEMTYSSATCKFKYRKYRREI